MGSVADAQEIKTMCEDTSYVAISGEIDSSYNPGDSLVDFNVGDYGVQIQGDVYRDLNQTFADFTNSGLVDALNGEDVSFRGSSIDCKIKGGPLVFPEKMYFPSTDIAMMWDEAGQEYIIGNGNFNEVDQLKNSTSSSETSFNMLPLEQKISANARGYVSHSAKTQRWQQPIRNKTYTTKGFT